MDQSKSTERDASTSIPLESIDEMADGRGLSARRSYIVRKPKRLLASRSLRIAEDIEDDDTKIQPPSLPQNPSSTAYEGAAAHGSYQDGELPPRPAKTVSRSRTLLKKIEGLKSPRNWKPHNAEQYRALQDEDETVDDEMLGIDLSTLGGPIGLREITPKENTSRWRPSGGSNDSLESKHSVESDHKPSGDDRLGEGMVVGAQLQVNPTAVSASSSGISPAESNIELARQKTIRDIGQREARKRNVIVAVDGMSRNSEYQILRC